jgi:hypothetical protein
MVFQKLYLYVQQNLHPYFTGIRYLPEFPSRFLYSTHSTRVTENLESIFCFLFRLWGREWESKIL